MELKPKVKIKCLHYWVMFKKWSNDENLTDISIEICSECGLRRKTVFYKFENKTKVIYGPDL